MVFQDDFSKKQTLSDGATNFPDFIIREFGCYFLCLCFLNKKEHFSQQDIRNIYYKALINQAIDYDCFVRNPLYFIRGSKDLKKLSLKQYTPSQKTRDLVGRYRIQDPLLSSQGLQSHFVVLDPMTLDVIYDPIEKGSRHVREGELIDLRVFI